MALSGCGGSTTGEGGSGASGGTGATAGTGSSGGASSGGGSGGTGGCTSFVPCCDAQGNSVEPVCTPYPQCPPGSSFPASGICSPSSCSPEKPCGALEYCDYPDDLCGTGLPGKCEPRPGGCYDIYAPVCTCNGTIAGNDCDAYSEGTDIAPSNQCTAPAGMFSCGAGYCDASFTYCRHGVSDVGGEPDSWECQPIPAACNPATCACLELEPCGQWCEGSANGGFTLTCPGG